MNEQIINPDAKTATTNATISAVNNILLVLGDGNDDAIIIQHDY
jgi:hypothetical protein